MMEKFGVIFFSYFFRARRAGNMSDCVNRSKLPVEYVSPKQALLILMLFMLLVVSWVSV